MVRVPALWTRSLILLLSWRQPTASRVVKVKRLSVDWFACSISLEGGVFGSILWLLFKIPTSAHESDFRLLVERAKALVLQRSNPGKQGGPALGPLVKGRLEMSWDSYRESTMRIQGWRNQAVEICKGFVGQGAGAADREAREGCGATQKEMRLKR